MPPKKSSDAEHEKWMERALALARCGEALASPNPMVGAVLVRGGRVVGEGFHTYDGLRHAEIVALDAARSKARGATLYINLEPCCHTGRTGPCTNAVIAAGVVHVVAAMADPNPLVAGRGFQQLRKAGIKVTTGILEGSAQQLNEAFSTWVTARRPFVTLKSAMTLDGQLVLPPTPARGRNKTGRIRWITSPESRAEVQRMRHASDAVLTGIGTVLADDPLLTDRTALPRRRRLLRVVLDSQLRLSPRSQLARTAKNDVLICTCESASSRRAKALRRAGVEIFACPACAANTRKKDRGSKRRCSQPDLQEVLAELARRNILAVLLEAGATLNQAALAARVVDKVRLFYAPILTGEPPARVPQAPVLRLGPSTAEQQQRLDTLSDLRIERYGQDFAVEGYLKKT
jgi:diaminohydroxyphosphoribosylaminopyrimidine deaminase/5-amino-6-(5-phosphoribosylamino)uracil reductase